ncbi:MAG: hypothetical protein ACE5FM_06575 [Methyloligellaceae bacterium]
MFTHGLRIAALTACLALASCFGPGTPEEQLEAIEALQAKNLPLTPEQVTGLAGHIAKGREALTAGNKEQAAAAFGAALAILGKAEDAALYNKAD